MSETARQPLECLYFSHECPPLEESESLGLLNPEEIDRAGRFLHPRPRREFLLTRSALKCQLARRLGTKPRDLHFLHNAAGKPFLQTGGIHFNVSHTQGFSVIALGPCEMGVDVEPVRDLKNRESLARRWFHPGEVLSLETCHWEPTAFFTIWTAKEAVVKALGTGLGFGMDEVWIDGIPGSQPTLRQLGKSQDFPANWTLQSRQLGANFLVSLAYQGTPMGVEWKDIGNGSRSLK